jgi:hypothetical protein
MITKQPDAEFNLAYWDYLKRFEYKLTVKLGPSHTDEFKEFTLWCHEHLGTKYKDWFMTSNGKGHYTLFARSSKWATFLALTWIDVICY